MSLKMQKIFWGTILSPLQYAPPQTVLDDNVFETVKEYPDGYTGYNCSELGNLRYTLEPCSQHVWECTDGKLFKKACPEEMIFWFTTETCDFPTSEEPTCKDKKKTRETSWPLWIVRAANVTNEPIPVYPAFSEPITITTDCREVITGVRGIKECHPEYIHCNYGSLNMHPCPEGLVFDERVSNCVTMEECNGPLQNNSIPQQISPYVDESYKKKMLLHNPSLAEYLRQLPVVVSFNVTIDCTRSYDVRYEIEKCHPITIGCIKGKRHVESCPMGRVYKEDMGCMELKECQEAWDKEKSTPASSMTVQTEQSPKKPSKPELVPTIKKCVDKDGFYAMKPCHFKYVFCHLDSGIKLKCPKGFVFSSRFDECVGKEFCKE